MKQDIQFLSINYLRGPNLWTYRPVIEAVVDIGEFEDYPSDRLPGFTQRLCAWLPGLVEHRCGVGERGGFVLRLNDGTYAAHIMEHVAIELQNLAGLQAGFGKARGVDVRGVYKVAIRARNEQVGRAAITSARDIVMAAANDLPFDVTATVSALRELVDDHHLGPSTACIVDAATARKIPHLRLNDGNLVQLGHGRAQRRIWTAETDATSAIAEEIASDKDMTKRLLAACGVPVPEGQVVENPDEAWEAAQDIGLPVVVKPSDGNHGRGVSLDLQTQEQVASAFELAQRHGSEVLVERSIPGSEHRLLVVGGKVVACARGEEAWISGNGRDSVRTLVEDQLNTDPRRGLSEDFPLNKIKVDDDAVIWRDLARQGVNPDSILTDGQRILVQRNGNVDFDCTPEVHPSVAETVGLAARIVGLDIAGIDLVAQDISRPLEEQGAAIVEVNAGPGLLMHLKPSNGPGQPVGEAIVEHLFPNAASGRIPLIGVTGSLGSNRLARLIASLLRLAGHKSGVSCQDGVFFDGRQLKKGDGRAWDMAQTLLINRAISHAVFEHSAASILAEGLPYDRCEVGVLTDSESMAELAPWYIREPEQMFNVLRTQVDVVLASGRAVLNAEDHLLLDMVELCDGAVTLYALDAHNPALAAHRSEGGQVVYARDGIIYAASGEREQAITALPFDLSPLDASATLAACAVALHFGVSCELIAAGLESFVG